MKSLSSSNRGRNCPQFVRSVDSDGRPVVINVNQILRVLRLSYGYVVETPAPYVVDGVTAWQYNVDRSELRAAGVPLPC